MTASTDCVFCKIVAREIPVKLVFENDRVAAFDDIKPQAPVHVLVVPKDHIGKASDLNETTASVVGNLVFAANEIARARGIDRTGYRIVLNCGKDAGQEVFHIHLHLLGGRKFTWPPG